MTMQKKTPGGAARRYARALGAAALLVSLLSVNALAFLPGVPQVVWDPKVDATLVAAHGHSEQSKLTQFLQNIAQLKKQFDQMRDMQRYAERMHGNWHNPLDAVRLVDSKLAAQLLDIQSIGFGARDAIRNRNANSGLTVAGKALEKIQQISENKRKADETLRDDYEDLYGAIPEGDRGGAGERIERSYQLAASTTVETARIQEAIDELYTQADQIQEAIESADLIPEDRDRLAALAAVYRNKGELLQLKLNAMANNLAADQVANRASEQGERYRAEIGVRERSQEFYGVTTLGPAKAARKSGGDQ